MISSGMVGQIKKDVNFGAIHEGQIQSYSSELKYQYIMEFFKSRNLQLDKLSYRYPIWESSVKLNR